MKPEMNTVEKIKLIKSFLFKKTNNFATDLKR